LNWLQILKEDFLPITRVKVLARTLVREQIFDDFYESFKNADKNSAESKQFSRFLDNLSGNTPNRRSLFEEIDKFSEKKGLNPAEAKKRLEKLMELRVKRPTKTKDSLMKLITDLHNVTREVEVAKKKPDGASNELLEEQSKLRKETEAFLEERAGLPLTGKGGNWNKYPDAQTMWQYVITRRQEPYFTITPYEGNEDKVNKFAEMIGANNKDGKLYKKSGEFTGFNQFIKLVNSNPDILTYYNENIRNLSLKFVKDESSTSLDKDALRMTRDRILGLEYTVKTFTEDTVLEYIEVINESVEGSKKIFIPNEPFIKNYVMVSGMGDDLVMSSIAKTILRPNFDDKWVTTLTGVIRRENLLSDYAIERKLIEEIVEVLQSGGTNYKGLDLSEYEITGTREQKKRKVTDLVKNRKSPSRLSQGFGRLTGQLKANLPAYLRDNPSVSEAKIIENEYSDLYDVIYFNGKEENNKPTDERDDAGQIIMANTADGATHAQIYDKDDPTEIIQLKDIYDELVDIGEQRTEEGRQFNNPTLIRLRELSGLTDDVFSKHLISISETKGLVELVNTFDISATIPNLSLDEFIGFIGLNAEVVGADGLLDAYAELDKTGDVKIADQIKEDIPIILNNLKKEIISAFENHVKLFAENFTGGKFKLGRGGSTKAKKALEALSDESVGILRES
tara:strand:- start:881 stop:2917 length:2037 start_codon:yes stop_codon:yes gene_type:complete